MPSVSFMRIAALILCLALAGCGSKKTQVTPPPREKSPAPAVMITGELHDFQKIPQDLAFFAQKTGSDKRLVSSVEQNALKEGFISIFFRAWDMTSPDVSKSYVEKLFRRARGYKDATTLWTQMEWDQMLNNANMASFPSLRRKGITLRHTGLRELPTATPRFDKPTPVPLEYPFDYFQQSALALGTPVFVTHQTRDRQWYYVESSVAAGWIPVRDIGLVSEAFINDYKSLNYATIIQEKLPINTASADSGQVHIGAVFPVEQNNAENIVLRIPVRRSSTTLDIATVSFSKAQAALLPIPFTPGNMARLGNQMLGQRYGWGGYLELRDCSSTTRDLFAPFGIWLPRNSAAQSKRGFFNSVEHLPNPVKDSTIRTNARPFQSLVWLPGHIALYIGEYENKSVIFHNAWGVRIIEAEDDDARFVIGRAVISTLEPGKELPNLYQNKTLIDRVRAYTTLPRLQ